MLKVKKKRSRFAIDFDSPVDSGTTTPDKEEDVELFCYCRQPDSPDMIGYVFIDLHFLKFIRLIAARIIRKRPKKSGCASLFGCVYY